MRRTLTAFAAVLSRENERVSTFEQLRRWLVASLGVPEEMVETSSARPLPLTPKAPSGELGR
jgi:hypothetical protein